MASRTLTPNQRPRVAIYSHDTMGLGHFRRNLLLAKQLSGDGLGANVLLISGACEAQRYRMPAGVDCLTLPAIGKTPDGQYQSRRLRAPLSDLVELRTAVIQHALESFQPDLLLVDNIPQGVEGELLPSLRHCRDSGRTRLILGLRDITDAPIAVRREWAIAGNTEIIRDLYDCIWIYGDPRIYDRTREDGLAPDLVERSIFVGYLDQRLPLGSLDGLEAARLEPLFASGRPLVACLVGGGQDGARLASAFAQVSFAPRYTGAILAGPFLDSKTRVALINACAPRDDLLLIDFLADPRLLIERAARVISMGGYNTIGEILSFEKRSLVVPRVHPRAEQQIRAQRLYELDLIDAVVHPDDLSPDVLSSWLARDDLPVRHVRDRIDLGALDRIPMLSAGLLASSGTPRAAISAAGGASNWLP